MQQTLGRCLVCWRMYNMIPGIVASQSYDQTSHDPYWSDVVSLLHFNGTDGSGTFTDETGRSWNPFLNARLSTSQKYFGVSSYTPFSSSSGIRTINNFLADSDDWTVEFFLRTNQIASGKTIFDMRTTGAGGIVITQPGANPSTLSFYSIASDNTTGSTLSSSTISINTWYAIAYTKDGNTYRAFIDGTKIAEETVAFTPNVGPQMSFGNNIAMSSTVWFDGFLDEFRFTKNVCRYTDNYTVATKEFPNS